MTKKPMLRVEAYACRNRREKRVRRAGSITLSTPSQVGASQKISRPLGACVKMKSYMGPTMAKRAACSIRKLIIWIGALALKGATQIEGISKLKSQMIANVIIGDTIIGGNSANARAG
jgi:hypothetical protein